MSVFKNAVHWAGEHPVPLAIGVFAIGAVFLLLTRSSGGASSDGGMSAFYAAQASQAAQNTALIGVQDQDKTATAIAGIAAQNKVDLANVGLASQNSAQDFQNSDAQINLAEWFGQKFSQQKNQDGEHAYYLAATTGNQTAFDEYLAAYATQSYAQH